MTSKLLLISLTLVAAGRPAAAQADEAQRFLRKRHDAVRQVLQRSSGSETARERRNAKLDGMLADLLDYRELSRRALGSHWKTRSRAERQEFVDLLKQLVEQSYKRNLERTLDYRIRYVGADEEAGGALVRTVAKSRDNPRAPAVSIDYRLHRKGGQWKVYDVITDGVSMVRNYRNQFNQIIAKKEWSGLIARMRDKLDS